MKYKWFDTFGIVFKYSQVIMMIFQIKPLRLCAQVLVHLYQSHKGDEEEEAVEGVVVEPKKKSKKEEATEEAAADEADAE